MSQNYQYLFITILYVKMGLTIEVYMGLTLSIFLNVIPLGQLTKTHMHRLFQNLFPSGDTLPFITTIFRIFCNKVSISSTFYVRIFCAKFWRYKVSKPKQSFVIFGAKISYKNLVHKTLMKLTQARRRVPRLQGVPLRHEYHHSQIRGREITGWFKSIFHIIII